MLAQVCARVGVYTCEVAQCRSDDGCWRPLCPYRHSVRDRAATRARVWLTLTAVETERLAPQGREARERKKETLETRVVADVVEGVSVEAETLVPREQVRHFTAEQGAPQFREETVDEELQVPCERVQQLTAEQIGNVPPRDDVPFSATATSSTVAKLVGDSEARPPEFAKDSAATAFLVVVPTVARSVGDGETQPPEFAKDSATTAVLEVVPTVAESVGYGEARPPEFAKHSTTTESKVAVSSGGAGPEQRVHPVPRLQQPQGLLAKLGIFESQSRGPRQNSISLCPLAKLGFLSQSAVNAAAVKSAGETWSSRI